MRNSEPPLPEKTVFTEIDGACVFGYIGQMSSPGQVTTRNLIFVCCVLVLVALQSFVHAHEVPGKPSHVLSDDPDAPPSLQMETESGRYLLTLTAFPASPKPGQPGTVNLYASRIDDGHPFIGEVTFEARDDGLFSDKQDTIGTQQLHGDHYSQEFVFKEAGDYVLRAEFEADGATHVVELPLTVGTPSSLGTIGAVGGAILIALVTVNLMQRRRLQATRAGDTASR